MVLVYGFELVHSTEQPFVKKCSEEPIPQDPCDDLSWEGRTRSAWPRESQCILTLMEEAVALS